MLDEDDLELIRENENLGKLQSEKVNFCAVIFFVPLLTWYIHNLLIMLCFTDREVQSLSGSKRLGLTLNWKGPLAFQMMMVIVSL